MAISLTKGQKVDLTKGKIGLSSIRIGLGWDASTKKKKGLLSNLLGGITENFDCDASVILLNEAGEYADLAYFGKLKSNCKSVIHMGDNITGEGQGDDEVIHIELAHVPSTIAKLIFVVNIYNCQARQQDFGMIQNAYIRVLDDKANEELIRFNLTDSYQEATTLMTGEIYRHQGEWKFAAIGEGTQDSSLKEVCARFQ